MLSLFAAASLVFTLPTAPLAPAAPAVARSTAPQMMDFFGGLQQGLAKVMAGSYDENCGAFAWDVRLAAEILQPVLQTGRIAAIGPPR